MVLVMFKIEKEETEKVIRTIRFSKKLNEKIETEAKKNEVSFSKFVMEACIYALENIEEERA